MESDTTNIQKLTPQHAAFFQRTDKLEILPICSGMDYIDEAAVAVKLVSSCGLEFNIGSLQHFGSKKEYPLTFLEKNYKKKKQRWRAPRQDGRTERSAGTWSRVKVVESTSRRGRKSNSSIWLKCGLLLTMLFRPGLSETSLHLENLTTSRHLTALLLIRSANELYI
jgi:hypothetical protein